jgi:hypothetical protein
LGGTLFLLLLTASQEKPSPWAGAAYMAENGSSRIEKCLNYNRCDAVPGLATAVTARPENEI